MLKALIAVLFFVSSAPVFACSCMLQGTDVAYEQASTVFIGTVAVTTRDRNGHPMTYRLTPGKIWKGDVPAVVEAPAGAMSGRFVGGCNLTDVEDGADYLVYAGENLHVSSCSRTKALKRAQLEMRYLDALKSGQKMDLNAVLPGALTGAEDDNVRAEAAKLMSEVMNKWEPTYPAAFPPALLQGAQDKSAAVRFASVRAFGPLSRLHDGENALTAALKDGDREVRSAAVEAFVATGTRSSKLFRSLVDALRRAQEDPDPDNEKQEQLLNTFSRVIAPAAASDVDRNEVVPLLQELVEAIQTPVFKIAPIQQLGGLKNRARSSAPQLLRVLATADNAQLRDAIVTTLRSIGASEALIESGLKP